MQVARRSDGSDVSVFWITVRMDGQDIPMAFPLSMNESAIRALAHDYARQLQNDAARSPRHVVLYNHADPEFSEVIR